MSAADDSPRFTLVEGDLALAEADAIVNAWNRNFIPHWLLIPQGVSKALRRRGGKGPFREIRRRGLLGLGEAVATGAGELSARWMIHVAALHAYWSASPKSVALGSANAFRVAAELGVETLATPLLGAGTGGVGPETSLRLLREAWEAAPTKPRQTLVYVFEPRVFASCQALAAREGWS